MAMVCMSSNKKRVLCDKPAAVKINKTIIDYLLFIGSLRIYFNHIGTSSWPGKDLHSLGLCSALNPFEQKGSLLCRTCYKTKPLLTRSYPKDRLLIASLRYVMGTRFQIWFPHTWMIQSISSWSWIGIYLEKPVNLLFYPWVISCYLWPCAISILKRYTWCAIV